MAFLYFFTIALFMLLCVLLCSVILMQDVLKTLTQIIVPISAVHRDLSPIHSLSMAPFLSYLRQTMLEVYALPGEPPPSRSVTYSTLSSNSLGDNRG